jgi:hypothetical protein
MFVQWAARYYMQEVYMNIQGHIQALNQRKKQLDSVISSEYSRPVPNETKLHHLKAQRLHILDELSRLQSF